MLSRNQKWAQETSQLVAAHKNEPWKKKYGTQCLHLPAMIHQCGLCQTLTFLEAKSAKQTDEGAFHQALLNDLAKALEFESSEQLLRSTRESELTEYQQISRNAIECANYLKRYAEAILRVELGADPAEQDGD